MKISLRPASRKPLRTVSVSPSRRRVNAVMITVSTLLAVLAMMTSSSATSGFLQTVGMSAAITTATLVSIWHLAAAGRRARLAYGLCLVLILATMGTAISTYMLSQLPTGIKAWGHVPSPGMNAVLIGTFLLALGALPLAMAISVLGLRPMDKSK